MAEMSALTWMGRVWVLAACLVASMACANDSGAQQGRTSNSLGMEFVLIPSGGFLMGSPPNEPFRDHDESQHKVLLSKPFYIQTTEVTQGQWKALMGQNPSHFKECGDRCPVERVSWFDGKKFVERLNQRGEGRYRLPTEAEWEYVCRAGTSSAFYWGEAVDCAKAMFGNNSLRGVVLCLDRVESLGLKRDSPAPVASYPPNPWGVFDMHGNVWEWCEDWYAPYPQGEVSDPKGPGSGEMKVRRGGSWFKFGTFCRSANRNFAHPANRYSTTGLRLVREVN
ncbi:MAG: formylglycine-generating enzyme family protein [Thermodesulfobacteriota bacterium]